MGHSGCPPREATHLSWLQLPSPTRSVSSGIPVTLPGLIPWPCPWTLSFLDPAQTRPQSGNMWETFLMHGIQQSLNHHLSLKNRIHPRKGEKVWRYHANKYEGIMPISFFARSEEGARSLKAPVVVIHPHSWQGGSWWCRETRSPWTAALFSLAFWYSYLTWWKSAWARNLCCHQKAAEDHSLTRNQLLCYIVCPQGGAVVLYLGCRSASPRGISRNTDARIPPPEILIVPGCNPSITRSGLPTKTLYFCLMGKK